MANRIIIEAGDVRAEAELNETRTARLIWNSLPLEAQVNTWGQEIYFEIPVKANLEDAVELVAAGDLGYWPSGFAFCIFFGPTPISGADEIRPASAVNIVGKVSGDARVFRSVAEGAPVRLKKAE